MKDLILCAAFGFVVSWGLSALLIHIGKLHEAIDHGFDDFGAALERELRP